MSVLRALSIFLGADAACALAAPFVFGQGSEDTLVGMGLLWPIAAIIGAAAWIVWRAEEERAQAPINVEDAMDSLAEFMKWYREGTRSQEEWAAAVRSQAKHYP